MNTRNEGRRRREGKERTGTHRHRSPRTSRHETRGHSRISQRKRIRGRKRSWRKRRRRRRRRPVSKRERETKAVRPGRDGERRLSERTRSSERTNERKREEARRASGCGRDEDGQARSGGTCNESEKDDEIGLCRRRRDSTERAGVPQTGRRLSGMQASAPAPVPLVGRAGSLRSLLPHSISSSAPPPTPPLLLSSLHTTSLFVSLGTQPPTGPTVATSSSTTTIANYGTQAQVRAHGHV